MVASAAGNLTTPAALLGPAFMSVLMAARSFLDVQQKYTAVGYKLGLEYLLP